MSEFNFQFQKVDWIDARRRSARTANAQPPDTAGSTVITSPAFNFVSQPCRSQICVELMKTLMCRRNWPVSSQMLRCNSGCSCSSCDKAARTLVAASSSVAAPAQQARNWRGICKETVFETAVMSSLEHGNHRGGKTSAVEFHCRLMSFSSSVAVRTSHGIVVRAKLRIGDLAELGS